MGLMTGLQHGRFFRPAVTLGAIGVIGAAGVLAAQTVGLVADRYALTVEGREIASFSELQEITSAVVPDEAGKLPGKRTPPTVTLKRGMTRTLEMWAWHEAAVMGNVEVARKNASLVMYSADGTPVSRWNFTNAWPSKVGIGVQKAGASEVLMETVTLTSEHLERVVP